MRQQKPTPISGADKLQCLRDREICHKRHMYVKRDLQTGTKHVKGGLQKRPVYNGKRRIWSLYCHKRLAYEKRHLQTRTPSMKRDLQMRSICNGKRPLLSLNCDLPFEAQKRKFCSTNISWTTMYAERILHNTRLYMKRELQKRPVCNGKRPIRRLYVTKRPVRTLDGDVPSYVRYDSFICGTWLIHIWDMTHPYVGHASFMSVT